MADIRTLTTLPDREYISGLAEVVKYGMILDADFFIGLKKMPVVLEIENNDLLPKSSVAQQNSKRLLSKGTNVKLLVYEPASTTAIHSPMLLKQRLVTARFFTARLFLWE